ncbi:hypothetical protein GGI20_003745 [Coemansia sp. BCRC 34301]|nr:hypothetical protein GGI20_003745 [Coemansia sp. BCRC 34301]
MLLHECADTLESLAVDARSAVDAKCIFINSVGKTIKYPHLKSLWLFVETDSLDLHCNLTSPQVFLPRLARLHIEGEYPFNNDELLKSTSKTLEAVSISMNASLLAILGKSNAFNSASYPNMRLVTLFYSPSVADRVDHSQFVLYAARVAQSQAALELHAASYIDDFVASILQGPPIQTLQYLNLERARLSLSSLFSLVSLLPRLSQISFGYFVLDELYLELSRTGLHDHVASKWGALSKNLQYCHISCYEEKGVDAMATCGMLLSISCARFTRLVVHGLLNEKLNKSIERALEKEPFVQYEEQLRRLVF